MPIPPTYNNPVIGTDLVDIVRIERLLERHAEAFERRVFTDTERLYCHSQHRCAASFAVRFAAKEAVAKAFGVGIGAQLAWKSVAILPNKLGAPEVFLDAKGQALLQALGGRRIHISLSHTRTLAVAVAVIE